MKRALILDTETNGLDPSVHHAIEVACILYDLERATPIASYASLIRSETNEAEAVNRISVDVLQGAPEASEAWSAVHHYVLMADVILAHRAEFDRSFTPKHIAELKTWVCTKTHVEWPLGKPGDHLVQLALAHGVPVLSAHRALTDCDILARLLTKVGEDGLRGTGPTLQTMLARAMRPRVKMISLAPFEEKDIVKAHGFLWDSAVRVWHREMPPEDVAALPFPTRAA
jgi:DNA polymerase-3 subunit epsilon